jgi:hypothetical protein
MSSSSFSVLAIVFLLVILLTPIIGLAQDQQGGDLKAKVQELYNNAVRIAFPIAVVILIFAGYMYITSAGNPETLGMAKNLIFGVISGLVVLLLAGLILETIGQTAIHNPSTDSSNQPSDSTDSTSGETEPSDTTPEPAEPATATPTGGAD